MNTQSNFTLKRQEAADRLGVSLRTVDRYLNKGKLDYTTLQGSVLISAKSVGQMLGEKNADLSKKAVSGQGSVERENVSEKPAKGGEGEVAVVYKKLYEETVEKLEAAQRRLEGANYRVGELESQMKSSVPLLEYHAMEEEKKNLNEKVEKLNREVQDGVQTNYKLIGEIDHASRQAIQERNKNIFHIILSAVLFVAVSFLVVFYVLGVGS